MPAWIFSAGPIYFQTIVDEYFTTGIWKQNNKASTMQKSNSHFKSLSYIIYLFLIPIFFRHIFHIKTRFFTFLSFFHYKYISSTNKLQLWSIQHIIYAIVCVFPKNLQVYSSHLHVIQYIHAFLIRREIHSSHNMFNFLLWKTIFSPDFLEFKPTVLLLLRHAPTSLTSSLCSNFQITFSS